MTSVDERIRLCDYGASSTTNREGRREDMNATNWADALTPAEIIRLSNILINGTNCALNVARDIEWKLEGSWDGYHDYADIARDNRTLLANLETAYAGK